MRGNRAVLDVGSGHYEFRSAGGIQPAAEALTTSKPVDRSLNPEKIDLSGAREIVRWDFSDQQDMATWSTWHNLKRAQREGKVFLVATGPDPQLATNLPVPLPGPLVVELEAQPTQATQAQFFWAAPDGNFNAGQQYSRQLNPAEQVNTYLFRIGDGQPIGKLRFDPLANRGELEVVSLTIYRL
jgi:alpha-L-rhamnosidase